MKISDTPEELIAENLEYIDERLNEIRKMFREAALMLGKYLAFINAGGAVAVLGFMGASDVARDLLSMKIALACFMLGVIFVGFLIIGIILRLAKLERRWDSESEKYLQDKIGWEEFLERESKHTESDWPEFLSACTSFFLFVLGSSIGIISLF